ncbi:MAG: DM13 domain-containing protein [Sulfitobacter sp.]
MTMTRRQFTGLSISAAAAVTLGATPSFAGSKKRTGQLSGRQGYKVSGTISVKKDGDTTQVILNDDYLFDPSKNPPDIKIGFGNGEKYAKGSKIHDNLTVKKGAATFTVPASIDTDKFNEIYIYCEKFTVILAAAKLS